MRLVSFLLSPLLIFWSLILVAMMHQHAGLNTGTEQQDFIQWGIYSTLHAFCALEILLSWINRREVSRRLVLLLYMASLIVLALWLRMGMNFLFLSAILPQAFLVSYWCNTLLKEMRLASPPPPRT